MEDKSDQITASTQLTPEIRSVLRAFILTHKEDMDEASIDNLQLYLETYHDLKLSPDETLSMVFQEKKDICIEMKVLNLEEDLFIPFSKDRVIKLGSCFCPTCGTYKEFRKECSSCSHHEITF